MREVNAALLFSSPCAAHSRLTRFVFVIREFVRAAWEDIERFKEQKDRDLREALISYAIMQISMCKKVCVYFCVADTLRTPVFCLLSSVAPSLLLYISVSSIKVSKCLLLSVLV